MWTKFGDFRMIWTIISLRALTTGQQNVPLPRNQDVIKNDKKQNKANQNQNQNKTNKQQQRQQQTNTHPKITKKTPQKTGNRHQLHHLY